MASALELWLLSQWNTSPRLIQTQTLASPASNVPFGPISTPFTRLTLYWQARLSVVAAAADLLMQIDGNSASSYLWAKVEAGNGVVSGAHTTALATSIKIGVISSDTTSYVGSGRQEIEGWSNTSLFLTSAGPYSNFDAVGTDWAGSAGGTFLAVGPHTSVKVLPSSGNFATGSTFSLYGSY